jgi:GDP-L-fucose synthase
MSSPVGYWAGRRVLVTGGGGFLGSHIVDRLRAAGAEVSAPRSKDYDLRERPQVDRMLAELAPQVVIHAAVDGGGIGYMRCHSGSVYLNNTLMNTHLLDACYRAQIEKFVGVSSVCAYPRDAPVPMREEDLWEGYPEPTNAAYGLSKKMMMEHGKAYREQYGFSSVFPMPVNLYGPRDHFDPERSHVVPALIRKCVEARERGEDHIVAWGTGRATRELLYVEDCADAVVLAAERLDRSEPFNVGTGRETPVKELVEKVAAACGYRGEIRWDTSKPDGQPRKCLDVSRAREWLGWEAQVSLEEGLRRTVEWYLERR